MPLGDMLITASDRLGRAGAVSRRDVALNLAKPVFLRRNDIKPDQSICFVNEQVNALLKLIPVRKTVIQVASGALPPWEPGFLGEQVTVLPTWAVQRPWGGGWAPTPCISASARGERRHHSSMAIGLANIMVAQHVVLIYLFFFFFLSVSWQGGAIHIKTKYAWACLHFAATKETGSRGARRGSAVGWGIYRLFQPLGWSDSVLTCNLLTNSTAFQVC